VKVAAVWGASGFIGGALCAAAEARGWSVRRLPRTPDAASLAGIELAYHCAGKAADAGKPGYAEAAERFARLCAEAGVRRLVYLGTVAVYGPRRHGAISADTPPQPADDYARSRLEAEGRLARALAGSATELVIARVPTVIGAGMPGAVLSRFASAVRWGVFVHPGPAEAAFACVGVRRLAQILLRLGEAAPPAPVVQFADQLPWADIARRAGARWRLRIPALGGKLKVLSSTVRYADDTARLFGADAPPPATLADLDAALRL
jgi:nucleoside-diphosphate-sugar epimerase